MNTPIDIFQAWRDKMRSEPYMQEFYDAVNNRMHSFISDELYNLVWNLLNSNIGVIISFIDDGAEQSKILINTHPIGTITVDSTGIWKAAIFDKPFKQTQPSKEQMERHVQYFLDYCIDVIDKQRFVHLEKEKHDEV